MTVNGRRNLVCFIWSAVGLMLIWRGLPYAGLREDPNIVALAGTSTWIALAIALVLGVGKGMSALRKGARRAATHIERQGEHAPFWSVFSPVMYILVAFMIGLGLALRLAPYDAVAKAWVVGILYPSVGVALLIGGQHVRRIDPFPQTDPAAAAAV